MCYTECRNLYAYKFSQKEDAMKDRSLLMDALAIIILLAILFFIVKGVPALMGGAHDASGNPVVMISTTQVLD